MDLELKLYECREYESIGDYIEPSAVDLLRQPKVLDRIKREASNGNGYKKMEPTISKMLGRKIGYGSIRDILKEFGIKVITNIDLLRRHDIADRIRKEASKGNGYKKIAPIISEMLGRDIGYNSINDIMKELGINVIKDIDLIRRPDIVERIKKEASIGNGCMKMEPIISEMLGRKVHWGSINGIMGELGINVITKTSILIDQIDSIMKLRSNGKSYREIAEIFSKKYSRKFTGSDIKNFLSKQKTEK